MRIKSKVKNTVLAGLAGLTLTACGGGGGGGATAPINNFVDNDLTNLSGSASLVSSYSNLLSDFQSVVSSGDISAIQGVITGPDQQDINQANTLLAQLQTAKTLWDQTEQLIDAQTDSEKYTIYNSNSFKEAHAAMIYLQNYVKPVIQKVANGRTITLADYNLVDKASRANEIIQQEKNSTSNDYANTKKIKSVDTVNNDTDESTDTTGTSTISYTDWVAVNSGGGSETRNKITTTPNIRTTVTTRCTFQRTTFLNNSTSDGAQTCSVLNTTTADLDPTVVTEAETREGENPVTATVNLDPTVTTATETSANYTETTYTDASDTTTETEEGSATTTTANRDVTTTTDHGNNTSTVTVVRYIDTTVTTPTTTKVYRTRNYTDTVKKDTRTVTTTVPRQQLTYKDGTTEIVNGSATAVNGDWSTTQLSQSQRSEKILQSETTSNQAETTSDSGTQLSSQLVSNTYTDNDSNIGTKTANLSTTVSDHQTTEYNNSTGLDMINAADAYAKGWTGEGAVLGVIDTYQDKDHADFNGKYQWYKDYVRNSDIVPNYGSQHSHGTHVAGIVAAEKNGTGTHGVAYNADLIGANVDYHGNGRINKGLAQQALHDMAKLKSPSSAGGEEMNIIAVNMSFNTPTLFYDGNGSTVTQLSDGTFSASEITTKIFDNGYGDSQYWKVATDNDIIIVNSAGNYGFEHAGDPGIWAVEEDSNGDLILGGKMVIVGNWDGSGVAGNKAGHVCLNINTVNNTCNDTHRLSEFYILAPGSAINSTIPTGMGNNGDDTVAMTGTSMSAPHVTGAFGIIHQMWPYMAGDKLVKLVMNTADKNLPDYNVNIHGQGLLDLDEATKPQGAVGLATSGRVDHPTASLNNTYYSTGTALPSSLSNLKIMVLDDYDRNYYIDIGSSFVVKDKRKFSDVQMLVDNKNTFLPHQQMYGAFTQGGQYDLDKNYNFGFYTGNNGDGDYSLNVGKDFYLNNKFKLKTSLAHMSEQDTWLGNSSDGVLGVGDNNDTTSANIGVAYQLGNNVLSLDYSKGKTDVNTANNSLIKSFSDIETESYRLAYEIHKDTHTTFGWSFSLPSHITSGTMDLEVAESVNLDGTINYTGINSNLAQSTKEKNLGFYYTKSGEDELDASFNFTAEYRLDKSGVANQDGVEIGMNFIKRFAGNCKFLWMKNPKCFTKNANGKDVIKPNLFSTSTDDTTKHGLVYDLKTDKFVPIRK
jgi:subtilisin family serine protease